MTDRNRAVLSGLAGFRSELEDLYRDLHQHPELGLREHRTAKKVSDALRDLGYEVTGGIGGTGVIGVLADGDGPTVMARADMVDGAWAGEIGVEGGFFLFELAAVVDVAADGGGLHLAPAQAAADPAAQGVGERAPLAGALLPSLVAGALGAHGAGGIEESGADDRFVGGCVGLDPLIGRVVGHAGAARVPWRCGPTAASSCTAREGERPSGPPGPRGIPPPTRPCGATEASSSTAEAASARAECSAPPGCTTAAPTCCAGRCRPGGLHEPAYGCARRRDPVLPAYRAAATPVPGRPRVFCNRRPGTFRL